MIKQRGIAHIGLIVLLIIGISVGVYLIKRDQSAVFKSQAYQSEILSALDIRDQNGNPLNCDESVSPPVCETEDLDIKIRVKDKTALTPNEALPLNDTPVSGDNGGGE